MFKGKTRISVVQPNILEGSDWQELKKKEYLYTKNNLINLSFRLHKHDINMLKFYNVCYVWNLFTKKKMEKRQVHMKGLYICKLINFIRH